MLPALAFGIGRIGHPASTWGSGRSAVPVLTSSGSLNADRVRAAAGFGLAAGDLEARPKAGLDAADEAGGYRHPAGGEHAGRGQVPAAKVWMPDQQLDHGGCGDRACCERLPVGIPGRRD
jgi:hypothetical protein